MATREDRMASATQRLDRIDALLEQAGKASMDARIEFAALAVDLLVGPREDV